MGGRGTPTVAWAPAQAGDVRIDTPSAGDSRTKPHIRAEVGRSHVRICTSQLSDASSAVCTRLSGTRSRSDLRSVTLTTSQPSSPGTRSISPESPNPASTPCASSSVPRLMKVSTPGTGVVPNALAHRLTAIPSSSAASSPAINNSTSRRCGGKPARLFSTTSTPAASADSRRRAMPAVNCAGVSSPARSTPTRTTAVLMAVSLSSGEAP